MLSDLRLITWLRWRQMRSSGLYWLRIAGYELEERSLSARLYGIYLLLFAAAWLFAMSIIALHYAALLGERLAAGRAPEMILEALPWAVLAGQVLTIAGALRASPLKLTFPDMAYVAASPLARPAPVLVSLAYKIGQSLLLVPPAAALVAVALAQALQPSRVDAATGWAALVACPLLILTWSLAWALGLARLAGPHYLRAQRLLWLAPFLLLPLAGYLPGALLWPGHAMALAAMGQAPAREVYLLTFLALPALAMVAWLSRRLNMADVMAESQTYARIQSLGFMAWLMPDMVKTIRRRERLATRRPFACFPQAKGAWACAARTWISCLRRPSSFLALLFWGAIIAQAGAWLALPSAYPAQWIPWLIVVWIAPSTGLSESFQADTTEPFLRQFLPAGNLRLLLADALVPLAILLPGALAIWLLQAPALPAALAGVALIIALAFLLILCRGLSLVCLPIPVLAVRAPYLLVAGVTLGMVIVTSELCKIPLVTLAVALALASLLAALVAHSRRQSCAL